jgi:hypothetical protein
MITSLVPLSDVGVVLFVVSTVSLFKGNNRHDPLTPSLSLY